MENTISEPLISVIVPVYNGQSFISGCLESLLNMDYPKDRFEIIAVDNNSNDDTAQIIKKYPVRYVLERTKGPSAARNRGAKESKGDILVFTDADVIVEKDWLSEIEKIFAQNENIDGVMGIRFGINRNIWAEFFQRYYEIFIDKKRQEGDNVRGIDTANFSIRKNVFTDAGTFNENFMNAEDAEFGVRLYEHGCKTTFSDKVRVKHINPIELNDIISARREQTFFAYVIAQRYEEVVRKKHFPTLGKLRYKCIFLQNKTIEKLILFILSSLLFVCMLLLVKFLKLLSRFGAKKSLYLLFLLVLGVAMYQGNILARMEQRGYVKISSRFKENNFKNYSRHSRNNAKLRKA